MYKNQPFYSSFIQQRYWWCGCEISLLAQFSTALWPPEGPPLPRGCVAQLIWVKHEITNRQPCLCFWSDQYRVQHWLKCLSIFSSASKTLFWLSVSAQDYEIEYMEKIGSSSPVSILCYSKNWSNVCCFLSLYWYVLHVICYISH